MRFSERSALTQVLPASLYVTGIIPLVSCGTFAPLLSAYKTYCFAIILSFTEKALPAASVCVAS